MKLNIEQLEKRIGEYYEKWSSPSGLNEYEKIALKYLEARYKLLKGGE